MVVPKGVVKEILYVTYVAYYSQCDQYVYQI